MKTNKFLILCIVFVVITAGISFFGEFFRDFLDDNIIILMFYVSGITGVVLGVIALRQHKRDSNKFSIYSVLLVTLIVATILFLIVMPPCQCGSRPRARDARIQSDLAQVRSIAGMIYDEENSYMTLCDNLNTLNNEHSHYGSQLKTLEDDVVEMLKESKRKGVKPVCFASTDSYCVSTALNYREDYLCVDASKIISNISKPCNSSDGCPTK